MNAGRNGNIAATFLPLALLVALALPGCGGSDDDDNDGGQTAQLGLQVQPTSVLLGQSAVITWSASPGVTCQAGGGWSGDQPASGNSAVTPNAPGSITYTLTCSGGGYTGPVTESATLAVTAATLAQIQDSVFTPRCTGCHDGSQPAGGPLPQSMNLTAGNSHTSLVGVPSRQQGTVLRIAPGDAAASYLVRKVEGSAGITGQRMPLGGLPLDAETIAQIKSWILAGAANN